MARASHRVGLLLLPSVVPFDMGVPCQICRHRSGRKSRRGARHAHRASRRRFLL